MFKEVKYKGKTYKLEYNTTVERRIDGFTTYDMRLINVDGSAISDGTVESWNRDCVLTVRVKHGDNMTLKTVILQFIKAYEEKKAKEKTGRDEFEAWDGDLDKVEQGDKK